MGKLSSATICTPGKFCATVYGDTAKLVNVLVVGVVLFIASVLIVRAVS
jgi:hypothetical protein